MSMREAPEGYGTALATSHTVGIRASVWRGGTLLAADLPVDSGELTEQADQAVPEAVNLTVPAFDDRTGLSYVPTSPLAPLAPFGQRLRLVRVTNGLALPLGWYRLQEWTDEGDTIGVQASGLLSVVESARLLAPTAPPVGATYASEFRRLVGGMLPVSIDPALADRPCPRSFLWEEDRLGSLVELLAAWPARMHVDPAGVLQVDPPYTDTEAADVTLRELDPTLGTVVRVGTGGTRDGIANAVVARGENTDDPARQPVSAIATDDVPGSPTQYGGPFGKVPTYFTSPLLTTKAQCLAAAQTRLRAVKRKAVTRQVDTVPDARLSASQGTRVDLVRASGQTERTRVLTVKLPLTADGGAASLLAGVI